MAQKLFGATKPDEAVKRETPKDLKMQIETEAAQTSRAKREARPHAFVIMPFGKKKGADGKPFDFNAIYVQLIKPCLEMAGFEAFRADEETVSGDILTDMFQELLLADLALVDMSIDNANVFYELGIRHAFRKRGVVHIQAGRAYMPFDIFNVRTIPYHITDDGVPDPAFLEKDMQAIARVTRDTWASEPESVHSPVFNLLSGLIEPDRKTLRTPLATGFWREYNEWKERVSIAQRQKRIGDILLLTEEIQNPLIKEEAIGEAGRALANMGRHELALGQFRKGLEINPRSLVFRREEAFHLNRIGRVDEAIIKLESILAEFPNESETIAFLGRIYKEMWVGSWRHVASLPARMKAAFEACHWLIKSIDVYLKGYRNDLNNNYPGINALTLSSMLIHLADKFEDKKDPSPEIARIRGDLNELIGALTFTLETKADEESADYWTLISLAELRVLTADNVATVRRAYKKALTASRRNPFYLNSPIAQLEILELLGLRRRFVKVGLETLHEELNRIFQEDGNAPKAKSASSKKVKSRAFLFAGYMADHNNKEQKTFPADMESEIRAEIRRRLEKFKASSKDIAFTAGLSAGSEIIFAELCAEKGLRVKAHLALNEAEYVREFVSPCGEEWVDRFYKIRNHPLVDEEYQSDCIGEPKADDDPFERNVRWALYSSLLFGVDKVRLFALWNGKSGRLNDRDARLVKHLVDLMRDTGGAIEQINPSKHVIASEARQSPREREIASRRSQ